MIAAGSSGMTDAEVEQFVEYFWRSLHPDLFIKLTTHPSWVDLVIEIHPDHSAGAVYRPASVVNLQTVSALTTHKTDPTIFIRDRLPNRFYHRS